MRLYLKFFLLFGLITFHHTVIYANSRPFHIFMVLWNGATSMETGFLKHLSDKNIPFTTEIYDCKGDRTTCHNLVPVIRSVKPDLIYIWGTPATEEIAGHIDDPDDIKQKYIWDIPIVSLSIADPLKARLIKSTKRTGRNLTGVIHVAPLTTQLNTMISYLPKLKVIAALYNPLEPNGYFQVSVLKELATLHNIHVIDIPIPLKQGVPQADSLSTLITKAYRQHAQFLYLSSDTFLSVHMKDIMRHANKYKLLTFSSTELHYWKGKPLLGVFNRFLHVGHLAAQKAESILCDKIHPSSIPFDALTKASIVIAQETFHTVSCPPPLSLLSIAHILK